jgi:hypothetical protein
VPGGNTAKVSQDPSTKRARKRRRRRVRTAGFAGVALGASLVAAGGTALALTHKRTRKLARKARRQMPHPAEAVQLASSYLPTFVDHLANGKGVGAAAKKAKKGRKAKK